MGLFFSHASYCRRCGCRSAIGGRLPPKRLRRRRYSSLKSFLVGFHFFQSWRKSCDAQSQPGWPRILAKTTSGSNRWVVVAMFTLSVSLQKSVVRTKGDKNQVFSRHLNISYLMVVGTFLSTFGMLVHWDSLERMLTSYRGRWLSVVRGP